MSGHPRGRKVRDRAEARRLIARWQKSELSMGDFCLRYGINVRSLSAYRRFVLAEVPQAVEANDFVEIKIAPQLPATTGSYRVELPNGIALTVSDRFTPDRLRQLVEVLRAC